MLSKHKTELRNYEIRDARGGALLFRSLAFGVGDLIERAAIRGIDLYGADLRSADLRYVNFRAAKLKNAVLAKADLRGALLHRADLRGADLHGAKLPDPYFDGVRPFFADCQGLIHAGAPNGFPAFGWLSEGYLCIRVGCQDLRLSDALEYWHKGKDNRRQVRAAVKYIAKCAKDMDWPLAEPEIDQCEIDR